MSIDILPVVVVRRLAWNKRRIIGQKRPFAPKHVWSIRVRLEMAASVAKAAGFIQTSQAFAQMAALAAGEHFVARLAAMGGLAMAPLVLEEKDRVEAIPVRSR
jgi:hypothetical protein